LARVHRVHEVLLPLVSELTVTTFVLLPHEQPTR
jgi:hypothetical protein